MSGVGAGGDVSLVLDVEQVAHLVGVGVRVRVRLGLGFGLGFGIGLGLEFGWG